MSIDTRADRRIGPAFLGAAALGLASLAAAAPAAGSPRQHVVTMANMSFGRLPANVHVGDTIVWVNRDTVPHTATARNKSFDVRVGAGKRASMTVKQAGNVPIYCIYHPAMRGSLKVAQ